MKIKTAIERWPWPTIKPHVQTSLHFVRVKKGCVLMRLESWPQCSINQLQRSNSKKLLKCKRTIQIATFNVRTLNRIRQLPELTASAIDHNIDIICIQEHRFTHCEDIKYHDTGNEWTLATASAWKNSVNALIEEVGILIGPQALKSLNSIEKIHPMMMVTTFNGNLSATMSSPLLFIASRNTTFSSLAETWMST